MCYFLDIKMKTVWKNIIGQHFVKDVGRNEKCPCGSGKKFKKCCIDKCGRPILRCLRKKSQRSKSMLDILKGLFKK